MNPLLQDLQTNDKKGFFKPTQTSVSYPTLFTPFDFKAGYLLEARDIYDKVIESYPSVGLVGGSFVTIFGKPGASKTTWAIQAAANIVRPFANGFVQHYDLERATTYTRVRNVTNFSQAELLNKYVIKQDKNYVEDMLDAIIEIAHAKEARRDTIMYDTGKRDEFGNIIKQFEPTVVIMDSIPVISSRDSGEEMEGSTYSNRVVKALTQFYTRLIPVIKAYNIIVIAINHVKQKIEINPRMKTAAQINYLNQNESLPGGWAVLYYANTLVRFTATGDKFTEEEDGFGGFNVKLDFIKSRTNNAGQSCNLIYTQRAGFDNLLSQFALAKELGVVEGRNPYCYFTGHKDIKFDSRKLLKEITRNDEIRYLLFDSTIPILEKQLSSVDDEFKLAKLSDEELLERIAKTEEDAA